MLTDELPAIAVEPELLKELEEVLYVGESIEDFMLSAVRDEVARHLKLREGAVGRGGPDDMPARGD